MKRTLLLLVILFLAWVGASLAIRFIGTMFFGIRNDEMSFAAVSILAAIAVAVWLWKAPHRSN
jgi:predicted tellurium resistance membrane protein TerC